MISLSLSDPGHRAEAGDEPRVSPGEDGANLTSPGVSSTGCERTEDRAGKPAGSVLVPAQQIFYVRSGQVRSGQALPEVNGKVRRADINEVEEAELESHPTAAEDIQPVSLASRVTLIQAFLHILLVLHGPVGADEESEEREEEAVVSEGEDEANHESQQGAAGGEVLGVAPAGRDDGDQGGRHPAEWGYGQSVCCPAAEEDILQDEDREAQDDEEERSQGEKSSGSFLAHPHLVPGCGL